MIRNVVLFKLQDGCDAAAVADLQDGLRGLNPRGCLAYTIGDDLGLREGNWSFAIVADFEDEATYREYDLDAEHNRLRALLATHVEEIARVQFTPAG
jgi:hypothetical protein